LPFGHHDGALGRPLAGELPRHALGRVDLLEPTDVAPVAAEMGRQLGGAEAVRYDSERVAPCTLGVDPVALPPKSRNPLPDRRARAPESTRQLLARERPAGLSQPRDEQVVGGHGIGSNLRLMSIAGAEWVSAPMATKS